MECIALAKVKNLKETYYPHRCPEEPIDDNSRIPGFAALSPSDQQHITTVLDLLPETDQPETAAKAAAKELAVELVNAFGTKCF